MTGHAAVYRGRFAPSPTGPLHAGSLVAALASWLDARAHGGKWLVRIEDVDTPRCVPGADTLILQQLAAFGLVPDEAPEYQSRRTAYYQRALDQLVDEGRSYPCGCSRQDIETAWRAMGRPRARHAELIYPGTCRGGLKGKPARAWRFACRDGPDSAVDWTDRRLGPRHEEVGLEVGDFILRRADGLWAYQLAVVVDDAAQEVTDVVRGEDLADNTARQILLQRALGFSTPRYLHVPLVLGTNGEKLSKQNGAAPLDTSVPLLALRQTGGLLGLQVDGTSVGEWLGRASLAWRDHFCVTRIGSPG
ncbi:MAG: tRNA glutamyl-Q(34) synthetase GluQRS [Pseudomonadota bacterium]